MEVENIGGFTVAFYSVERSSNNAHPIPAARRQPHTDTAGTGSPVVFIILPGSPTLEIPLKVLRQVGRLACHNKVNLLPVRSKPHHQHGGQSWGKELATPESAQKRIVISFIPCKRFFFGRWLLPNGQCELYFLSRLQESNLIRTAFYLVTPHFF